MMKGNNLQIAVAVMIVLATFCGCATERHIAPTLSESPRTGLELKPPILGAVFDGRATQDPKDAASQLQADLKRIYGPSIEWNDYFAKTPPGRVAVRVRLVTLGASFGSRLISTVAFANAVSSAQGNATGSWGTIVGMYQPSSHCWRGLFPAKAGGMAQHGLMLKCRTTEMTSPLASPCPLWLSTGNSTCGAMRPETRQFAPHGNAQPFSSQGPWTASSVPFGIINPKKCDLSNSISLWV